MSIFRNTVWFLKGMKEYTKNGYTTAAKHFGLDDLNVDCRDKSFLVTGSNSGIGLEVVRELAKRGGTVHMVCRNRESAEAARDELVKETENQKIYVHILDISVPKDVHLFTVKFAEDQAKLDVLVNNAGCMVNTREITEAGFEKNFATNTLGTYMITKGLEDVLKRSPDPRVVTVSSGGMLVQKLNVEDLMFEKMSPFDGTMAYAQNKRQQVVMTERWAAEIPDIKYYAMHPGWADTPAVRSSMPDFHRKMEGKLRTAGEGADTVVWLAVSKTAGEEKSGLFWQDRTSVNTHLPLAFTRTSQDDEDRLVNTLKDIREKIMK